MTKEQEDQVKALCRDGWEFYARYVGGKWQMMLLDSKTAQKYEGEEMETMNGAYESLLKNTSFTVGDGPFKLLN